MSLNFFILFLTIVCFGGLEAKQQSSLPEVVSTKNAPCNLRVGPGKHFPIDWVYNYAGTPFKVLAEFQGWYKVKDVTGSMGWIYKTLLTRKQTKIVIEEANLYKTDSPSSRIIGHLMPNVVVSIKSCSSQVCKVYLNHEGLKLTGYVQHKYLWPR